MLTMLQKQTQGLILVLALTPALWLVLFVHHQRDHVQLLLMGVVLRRNPTTKSDTMPVQTPCKTSFARARNSQPPIGTGTSQSYVLRQQCPHQSESRISSCTIQAAGDEGRCHSRSQTPCTVGSRRTSSHPLPRSHRSSRPSSILWSCVCVGVRTQRA